MSCTYRDRNETILAYVRQELNSETQEAFEEHYFICAECASEILFYEKTILAMHGQGGIVFAHPKQHRLEFIASMQYQFNRWIRNLALAWSEGGAIKAFVGYALLVVFLSSTSLGLLKIIGGSGTNLHEMDAVVAPTPMKTTLPAATSTHFDWPQDLKLTENPTLQAALDEIQPIYQNDKNYKSAGEALSRFLNTDLKIHDELKLFLSVCWFKQGRKEEAMTLLASINSPLSSSGQAFLQQLRKK
ncbi:MAG: zf-HC2 domain-containing protein [candidate division KSB1 bacterium]